VVIKSELRPIGYVEVTGEVKRHGRYAIARGERLSSLLERAGGFLPEAFPKGAVFTRESIRKIEQEELDKFLRAQEQGLIAESAGLTAGGAEIISQQDLARAQTEILGQRRELIRSLAGAVTLGRFSIRLDSPEKLKGTPSDILLEDGDSLVVPQRPTSVLVLGSVRNSTSILYMESEDVEYYLMKAGGTTRDADLDQGYILKPDGSAVPGFVRVRKVEAGDTVVVPISTEPRYRTIPLIKDIATIVAGFTLPLAAILAIAK
jgi:polysaccharide export outer membrane protein